MADFELAIDYVLKNEGGFVDIPDDRGGPTNRGITLAILSKWRGSPVGRPAILNLGLDETKEIYKGIFWDKFNLGPLEQSVATIILDTIVNQGEGSAIRIVQQTLIDLGAQLAIDGIMGSKSHDYLVSIDPRYFIKGFFKEVQWRYVNIVVNTPSQMKFLKGWLNRALRMLDFL